jgi:protein gp37
MSDSTGIEWTDATWNPLRGCNKISPGCKHCYAETFAERWRGVAGHAYERGFDLREVPELLDQPLRWQRPRMIFTNSMSDLFHKDVSHNYRAAVYAVMNLARWHTFQVLTKRADVLVDFYAWLDAQAPAARETWIASVADAERLCNEPIGSRRADRSTGHGHVLNRYGSATLALLERTTRAPRLDGTYNDWPPPNVWVGVSVEDRRYGLPRIEQLRQVPAAVRFLSIEPLLEDLGTLDLRGIAWVIVGGESGLGARPIDAAWVRSIRDQCAAAGVAFFFKQWGGVRKKTHGRVLDGRTHDAMPEVRRAA